MKHTSGDVTILPCSRHRCSMKGSLHSSQPIYNQSSPWCCLIFITNTHVYRICSYMFVYVRMCSSLSILRAIYHLYSSYYDQYVRSMRPKMSGSNSGARRRMSVTSVAMTSAKSRLFCVGIL